MADAGFPFENFVDISSDFSHSGTRDRSRSPVRRTETRWGSPIRSTQNSWTLDEGMERERRVSSQDPGGKVRLIISNIPFDARWQDIKDLYKEKVHPDGCFAEIIEGADGRPSGTAVIEVRGRELADKAISALTGAEMKGRQLSVREERDKDRIRTQRRPGMDGRGGGGMNGAGGGGVGMGRMGGGMGGAGGGSGFNAGMIGQGAMQLLSQLNIDPDCITNQIFVANLDYKVTAKKMIDIFQMAGNILQAEIKFDKEGNSRGMATVRFENPIEAVQAVAMFNNQYLFDRQMNVRMDKMSESTPQMLPGKLPQGLRGYGMGLGENGQPLMHIGQIANFMTLSNLSTLINGNSMGNMMSSMGGGGGNMGGAMGGFGALMAGLANSMGGGGAGGNSGPMGGGGWNSGGNNMSANAGGWNNGGANFDSASMGGAANFLASLASGFGGNMFGGTNAGGMSGGMGGGGMVGSGMGGGGGLGGGGGMGGGGNFGGGGGMGGGGVSYGGGSGAGGNYGGGGGSSNGGGSYGGGMGGRTGGMLLIKNLPFTTTWQELKDRFKQCGEVKFAEIKMENGRSRGCGTVRFANSDDARKAISMLNGTMFDSRQIEVGFE